VYQELPAVKRARPSGRLETTVSRRTEVRRQGEIVEIVVVSQHRLDSWKELAVVSLADTLHMRPVEVQVVGNKAFVVEERDTSAVLLLLAVEEKRKRILLHALPMVASVQHAFVLTWENWSMNTPQHKDEQHSISTNNRLRIPQVTRFYVDLPRSTRCFLRGFVKLLSYCLWFSRFSKEDRNARFC
jgi:hypothetical protein